MCHNSWTLPLLWLQDAPLCYLPLKRLVMLPLKKSMQAIKRMTYSNFRNIKMWKKFYRSIDELWSLKARRKENNFKYPYKDMNRTTDFLPFWFTDCLQPWLSHPSLTFCITKKKRKPTMCRSCGRCWGHAINKRQSLCSRCFRLGNGYRKQLENYNRVTITILARSKNSMGAQWKVT